MKNSTSSSSIDVLVSCTSTVMFKKYESLRCALFSFQNLFLSQKEFLFVKSERQNQGVSFTFLDVQVLDKFCCYILINTKIHD